MENKYDIPIRQNTNIIEIHNQEQIEVLRIAPDGRIFLKQREVDTDDEFRAAMLELKDALVKNMMPNAIELTGAPLAKRPSGTE